MVNTNSPCFSQNTPLLLLVEDNLIALRFIEMIVIQAGVRFISATDGKQALELFKTLRFELIITDLELPSLSGIELTYLIREWEKTKPHQQVPIIGLTAHVLNETKKQCLDAGMQKVLCKPIYLQDIEDLILRFVTRPAHYWPQGQKTG
jgi:CheY-like chemotaxis protein